MVPASPLALGDDTRFHGGILFEQVQSQLAKHSEILGRMAFTNPTFVFPEGHIEYPVEAVLNLPVSTTGQIGFWRTFGDPLSCSHQQDPPAQKIELRTAIALAFDELQPIDLTLNLSITPR